MRPGRPATILYVLNSASTGGGNRSLGVLLRGLDRRRYRPLAVAPSAGPFLERLREWDVPCTLLPCASLARLRATVRAKTRASVRNTINLVRLVDLMERRGVRLVHTNTIFPLGGALASRLTPAPHVWHLREGLDTPQYDLRFGVRASQALIGGLAERLVCISDYVRRVTVPAGARHRAVVIPNALEMIPPSCERVPGTSPLVGCVGLLGAKKRTALFVEAAAHLARRLPHARFVVAGRPTAGEENVPERCMRMASDLGIANRIEWSGFVADPVEIFRRLDLLIHPGTHEAFGRVLIEAMSWGVPVIGVRSGAIPEIVEDGVTGRVVGPDDAAALAAAAASVLESPGTYSAMASAARREALARYSPPAHVEAVEGIYAGMLGDR